MHHALQIEEILLHIFGHRHPTDPSWTVERRRSTADLAALARTCRAFKEAALDVLWSELIDLSPLAFCLPECQRSSDRSYSFIGPRNDAEWVTLKSYTRRVWRILSFSSPNGHLDPSCISATFDPSFVEPLFPNLRFLRWQGGTPTLPVMYFAVAPLRCLDIRSGPREDVSVYTHLLDTLVPHCPNIRKVRLQVAHNARLSEIVYRHLCSWSKLQVVDCLDVAMPADVIPHLSSTSSLKWLSFRLHTQSVPNVTPPPSAPFVFVHLVYLEVLSDALDDVTALMTHVQLPGVQVLIVPFHARPSRAMVRSYLAALRETCSPAALMDLRLLHLADATARSPEEEDRLSLRRDDLGACTAFGQLRAVHVNIAWASVELTDADMLALVGAWPALEHLVINDRWGWRTSGGITLRGLTEIVRRCACLWELCVVVDAESAAAAAVERGDVDLSARKHLFRLNVADSPIRRELVPVLRTALSVFRFSHHSDRFSAWDGSEMGDIAGADDSRYLWRSVFT